MKDAFRNKIRISREARAVLFFVLGTFLYSSTAVHFILENAQALPEFQRRFYDAAGILCIAGFLFYGLFCGRLSRRRQSGVLVILGIFYLAGIACTFATELIAARALCIFISAVFLGAAYHADALLLDGSSLSGRCTAQGFLLAYGLQYFLIIQCGSALLHGILLLAGMLGFLALLPAGWPASPEAVPDPSAPEKEKARLPMRAYLLPCAMTAVLLFQHLYFDRNLALLSYETAYHEYNIFGWPRLISLAGALMTGMIWDHKNGRYLPLSVVLVSLAAILTIIFFDGSGSAFLFLMCLSYFYHGCVLMFLIWAFRSIALRSRHPAFWAIQGRVTEKLTDAAGIFLLFRLPYHGVVAIQLLAMAAGVLLAFFWYFPENAAGALSGDHNACDDPAVRLKQFAESYALTERESEILARLITTEETGQEMADALFMSRRVLQRHISSLYEKTGTKSRIGLARLYYGGDTAQIS